MIEYSGQRYATKTWHVVVVLLVFFGSPLISKATGNFFENNQPDKITAEFNSLISGIDRGGSFRLIAFKNGVITAGASNSQALIARLTDPQLRGQVLFTKNADGSFLAGWSDGGVPIKHSILANADEEFVEFTSGILDTEQYDMRVWVNNNIINGISKNVFSAGMLLARKVNDGRSFTVTAINDSGHFEPSFVSLVESSANFSEVAITLNSVSNSAEFEVVVDYDEWCGGGAA